MAIRRYELSDAKWAKIAPLLPGKAADPGRRGSDNRLFINIACRSSARALWRELPERYRRWKTVHAVQPLVPWRDMGKGVRGPYCRPSTNI
jgi:putative transposase